MSRICKECPIAQTVEADRSAYQEGLDNGLFLQVIQGLSYPMERNVHGTKAGLTDERIEQIRQSEIRKWGNSADPKGEAAYLNTHSEIAKAVHDCEMKIHLGECAVHSVRSVRVGE